MGQINIYNDAGTNKLALTYTGQSEAEQLELTAKRQEAREYIRVNEGVL